MTLFYVLRVNVLLKILRLKPLDDVLDDQRGLLVIDCNCKLCSVEANPCGEESRLPTRDY